MNVSMICNPSFSYVSNMKRYKKKLILQNFDAVINFSLPEMWSDEEESEIV
jgi:hypothetical protein